MNIQHENTYGLGYIEDIDPVNTYRIVYIYLGHAQVYTFNIGCGRSTYRRNRPNVNTCDAFNIYQFVYLYKQVGI